MTVGSTFQSADGEYRHKFIAVKQIFELPDTCVDLINMIEDHIMDQLGKKEIELTTHTILPNRFGPDVQKQLDDEIEKLRLKVLLYKLGLVTYMHSFINDLFDTHTAIGFKEAMFSIRDKQLFSNDERFSKDEWLLYAMRVSRYFKSKTQTKSMTEIGQKFIPLTINDIENSEDIKLAPWREVFIASLASDLVINGITPGIPIYGDWFFIQGNSYDLWDNRVSKVKIDHSKLATDIVRRLEDARKGTYLLDPINRKKMYISFSLEGLSEAIDIPIEYAEQQLVLSDITLCTLTEHIGRTIANLPNVVDKISVNKVSSIYMFAEYSAFMKTMFGFIYTLHCLNSRLGVIHGDLHLNNVTNYAIHSFIDRTTNKPYVINTHVVYEVHGKFYIFKHYGDYSGIIDFSRSFMDREHLLKSFDEAKTDDVIMHQRSRMIRTIAREMPDFHKSHERELTVAIFDNFDACFQVFQAIDVFKLSRAMARLLSSMLTDEYKFVNREMVTKQAVPVLTAMGDAAYAYMVNGFQQLFKRQKLNLRPINLSILEQFFEYANIDKFTPPLHNGKQYISITDFFSADNEIKFNCREYNKFPEPVKFEYVIKHDIPGEELGMQKYAEYKEYLRVEKPEQQVEKIKTDIRNSQAERRGADPGGVAVPDPEAIKKFEDISSSIKEFYNDT